MVKDAYEYEKLTECIGVIKGSTNSGIINFSNELFLIDTGMTDLEAEKLCNTVEINFPGKRVVCILNTHAHADHVGGNGFVASRYNSQICASKESAVLMEYPRLMGSTYWGAEPFDSLLSEKFVVQKPQTVNAWVSEAFGITGSLRVQPLVLPGHVFFQLGFLVTDPNDKKKVFFAGDSFFCKDTLKKTEIPFLTDPVEFRNSIEKLKYVDALYFVPGHGEYYEKKNLDSILELNVLMSLEIEDLILEILSKGPLSAEELVQKMADYHGMKMRETQCLLVTCTVKSFLASLCTRNKVSHFVEDNRLLWKRC